MKFVTPASVVLAIALSSSSLAAPVTDSGAAQDASPVLVNDAPPVAVRRPPARRQGSSRMRFGELSDINL